MTFELDERTIRIRIGLLEEQKPRGKDEVEERGELGIRAMFPHLGQEPALPCVVARPENKIVIEGLTLDLCGW